MDAGGEASAKYSEAVLSAHLERAADIVAGAVGTVDADQSVDAERCWYEGRSEGTVSERCVDERSDALSSDNEEGGMWSMVGGAKLQVAS